MTSEHLGINRDVAILNVAELVSGNGSQEMLGGAFLEWRARHPEASQSFIDALSNRYHPGDVQRILHGFALALGVDAATHQIDRELALTSHDIMNNKDTHGLNTL